MRDYEVLTRDRNTGRFKGWKKIGELPMHALYWLRDCNWDAPAPRVEGRNGCTKEDVRARVEIEIIARSLP